MGDPHLLGGLIPHSQQLQPLPLPGSSASAQAPPHPFHLLLSGLQGQEGPPHHGARSAGRGQASLPLGQVHSPSVL